MSHARATDETTHLERPWWREGDPQPAARPSLERQVLLRRASRETAWTVAGWLLVAVLVMILLILVPIVWHGLSPWLTGGHP